MKRLLLALLLIVRIGHAADEPKPETTKHRVTGLFSPQREAALRAAMEKLPGVKLVSVDFEHAEAVFAYDAKVAFKDTKPEQVVERFNELLRNATRSTLGIAPLDATPKDKLTRIEIAVAGCDCPACGLAAYESIFKIAGVAAATVNFKDGRLVALVDAEKTNRAALEAALKKRGVEMKTPQTVPPAK